MKKNSPSLSLATAPAIFFNNNRVSLFESLGRRLRAFFRIIPLFTCLAMILCWTGTAHALSINDIRFGDHPGKIRMVLELSDVEDFRVMAMDNPSRLIIDLPRFDWNVPNINRPQSAAVSSIRQGVLQPGISRIVIDFKHPVNVSSAFILPRDTAANKPDRLVVDFTRAQSADDKVFGKLQVTGDKNISAVTLSKPTKTAAQPAPVEEEIAVATPSRIQQPVETPAEMAMQTRPDAVPVPGRKPAVEAPLTESPLKVPARDKKPLIVIDAGHGGVDPGALGANGVYEKQVTLNMAKALKEALEGTGRYKVLLTREKDTYLKLYKRVEFARMNHADLFISLHADSIGKSNVSGASIYTLSEKASDEQTALLADRENRADLIAGMDLDTNDEQVATILVDLTMRDTMNQSKFFANKLVGHMDSGNIEMLENPHRYAGFAVLKAPDIPSVLIEMGFMSNPREAAQLTRPEYRRALAKTLVTGIDMYFSKLQQMQRS